MKLIILFFTILLTYNLSANDEPKTISTEGRFDFKNPQYNTLLIAKLKEPALFTLYRYGDGGNVNSPVRISINVDGKLIEEELIGQKGKQFVNLEAESTSYYFGKEISIVSDPTQIPTNNLVLGQYKNNRLDETELIAPSWTLQTKSNGNIHRTIIPLGSWGKVKNVRVKFNSVVITSNHDKSKAIFMLYVDKKPFVDEHGTPYIFSEGNSVDITASSVSIGFYPTVPNTLKAHVRGSFIMAKYRD